MQSEFVEKCVKSAILSVIQEHPMGHWRDDQVKEVARRAIAEAALSTDAEPVKTAPAVAGNRHGIYIASKTKHAGRWRFLRDKVGEPIISTWIDEAGAGESGDLSDLWRRCILEASTAEVLILYREPQDVLKGGWVELGAALASGVDVFAVGIEEFTVANDKRIRHFPDMKAAIAAARAQLAAYPASKHGDAD